MKHAKRITALLLAMVMLVCCFAGTVASAMQVEEKVLSEDEIYEDVTTDRVATATKQSTNYAADTDSAVKNTTMLYYDTTPWYYLPALIEYATSQEAQNSGTYAKGLSDLAFVIPANMALTFTKAFTRNLTNTMLDIADDGIAGAKALSDTVSTSPVAGSIYQSTGALGKVAVYSTSLISSTATNTALLLLIQGVVNLAIVILVPITWIAIPLLGIQDGQFEIERIIGQLDKLQNTME